jgi:hypothetical protein
MCFDQIHLLHYFSYSLVPIFNGFYCSSFIHIKYFD